MAEATKVVDRGAGVLHIVKNYTGDVMNFEMAGELAAADSGVRVETVVTDDDVAVEDSTWTAGRRGVGVTVLLEKIVGAAAEEGQDLDAVVALARRVNAQGRSMGMALTSCTVPAAGKPTFDLPEDQMEMGVGIHGEPGRHRVPLAGAAEIAEQLVEPVLADLDFAGRAPASCCSAGSAARPLLELYLLYGEVATLLEKAGRPGGPHAGRQLHHLPRHGRRLGDRAAGRRRDAAPVGCSGEDLRAAMGSLTVSEAVTLDQLVGWLSSFRDAVHENGDYLTALDSAIGDADHGANLIRGMDAVMTALDPVPDHAGELLKKVGMTLVTSVGGASGPLYGTFFLRAAAAAGDADDPGRTGAAGGAASRARGHRRPRQGRGRRQDDVRRPGPGARRASSPPWARAPTSGRHAPRRRRAAAAGRDATEPLQALKGRASYLGERSIGHIDPGAASSALLVDALADAAG